MNLCADDELKAERARRCCNDSLNGESCASASALGTSRQCKREDRGRRTGGGEAESKCHAARGVCEGRTQACARHKKLPRVVAPPCRSCWSWSRVLLLVLVAAVLSPSQAQQPLPPSQLDFSHFTFSSINASWVATTSGPGAAASFDLRWRPVGAAAWMAGRELTAADFSFVVTGNEEALAKSAGFRIFAAGTRGHTCD
jgi:hypothetical protein